MTFVIQIPNWHPTPLNKLMSAHHMAAHRMKLGDMQMIGAYAVQAKVPKATGRRRVGLTITLGKGQRACDPDAYFKSSIDALVRLGYLKDDNRQWLELMPVKFDRGEKATTIAMADL